MVAEVRASEPVRVLIVDEYPLSRRILPQLFTRYGYTCAIAASAEEAVCVFDAFAPDVVVLEWMLRAGGGGALSGKLRRRAAERGRQLVVVILSVCDEPCGLRDREHFDHYFVKPSPVAAIERAIRGSVHAVRASPEE